MSDTKQLAFSAAQIDAILATAQRCSNRNLLDNWYFGNPVDQRGGYVVPPGKNYYVLGEPSPAGQTEKYYPVWKIDTQYNSVYINIDGINYAVVKDDAVRGYTGTGYGIDRWYTAIDNGTVVVEDDGVLLVSGTTGETWIQKMEQSTYKQLVGKKITLSVLYTPITTDCLLWMNTNDGLLHPNIALDGALNAKNCKSVTLVVPDGKTEFYPAWFYAPVEKSVRIHAIKLELGDQQTLAHQDANGNWVLNEPPLDKNMELLKCQRYYQLYSSADKRPVKTVDCRPTMRVDPVQGTIAIDGTTYYYNSAEL